MAEVIPIDYHVDGNAIFSKLYDLPYACWLDSGKPRSQLGRYDIISALPALRLVTQDNITTIHSANGAPCLSTADPLELLKQELTKLNLGETKANTIKPDTPALPFSGGAIGYFSYDLGRRYIYPKGCPTQPASSSPPAVFADMQVGIYHWAIVQDHHLQSAWLSYLPECCPDLLRTIQSRLASEAPQPPIEALQVASIQPIISQAEYAEKLQCIDDYILAGDCYQTNFTQCFQGRYTGKPYSAYQQLRQLMASPFSAYLQLDQQAVMSLSPERFLQVQGRRVTTEPIKGTTPRHANKAQDKKVAQALQQDQKNRAENLMIVDLLRNDLGRHCIPGSIAVDKLFDLQAFPNVHHLVSTISGQLDASSHSLDVFRDCFPGGSITGAPKKRAMEIIDELESGYRGIYCGSIGYINANGDMDTNIAIRTISCDGQQLYCWAGGGIVADSEADAEYQESLDKINALLQALRGQSGA